MDILGRDPATRNFPVTPMNLPKNPYVRERIAARARQTGLILGRWLMLPALALALAYAPETFAQTPNGTIEGRVKNAVTVEYLEKARVSVKGSTRVTLTDATGSFLLTNVPAGSTTLRVFFTGLDEQEVTVNVT